MNIYHGLHSLGAALLFLSFIAFLVLFVWAIGYVFEEAEKPSLGLLIVSALLLTIGSFLKGVTS